MLHRIVCAPNLTIF